jgi:hypothetical protein
MFPLNQISPLTSLIGFVIGLPTAAATYYQAWKTRKEAAQARAGLSYSKNCLEFVLEDGSSVNLVPLDSLQTMPQPGEIVLLPGSGLEFGGGTGTGAYRVGRVEHIYARLEGRGADPKHARLIKVVAHVSGLAGADEAREDVAEAVID